MKRIIVTFAIIATMLICSMPVYADMGIPTTAEFTVAIRLDGCNAYEDTSDLNSNMPSKYLDGGVAFYVYNDFDGFYYGTTETAKDPQHMENFVYVRPEDTINSDTEVDSDSGEDTGYTIEADTTDELNLRTGPGIGFKVKKVLKKGTGVTYTHTFQGDGEWAYVSSGSDYGWVSVKYLNIKNKTERGAEPSTNVENQDTDEEENFGENEMLEDDKAKASDNKYLVAGVICICLGAAILIASIAYYLLKKRGRR